jgi:hypothetical protein
MTPRRPGDPTGTRPLPRLDGCPGPALSLTPDQMDRAVDAVLRAADAGDLPPSARPRSSSPKMVRVVAMSVFLAATLALLASLAFAGLSLWRASHEARMTAATPFAPPKSPASPVASSAAGSPILSLDSATPLPRVATRAVESPVGVPQVASSSPTSADMLREANALRAARRWREAASMYERVVATQPRSDDAYAALVATGALRGAHLGDPRSALRLLAAADRLRPGGPLAEEIAWNRILSYGALGETAQETAALESFVSTYGDSPWQSAARNRLRELTK